MVKQEPWMTSGERWRTGEQFQAAGNALGFKLIRNNDGRHSY